MTPEQREIARANAQRIVNAGGTDAIDYPVAVGFLSLIDQVEALNRKENALQGLADLRYAEVLELTAQLSEALTVPQGWKLVPVLSTGAMDISGMDALDCDEARQSDAERCYDAMLAAAPTIPAIPGTKEGA